MCCNALSVIDTPHTHCTKKERKAGEGEEYRRRGIREQPKIQYLFDSEVEKIKPIKPGV